MTSINLVPHPRVYLIAPAVQYFGEPLTLTCEVTTMRGITSGVTIKWSTHGNGQHRIVENVNGSIINNTVVYRDLYHIPRLTTEDYFSCRGIINSIPQRSDTDFIILRAICK